MKFRWETEFKETEIGEIPRDWEVEKIEKIGEIGGGTTPSTKINDYWGGHIPWITPKDLSILEYRFIQKGERNITEKAVKENSLRIYPAGTVLLTSRAPIGYVAIAKNSVTTNQGFKNIIPKDKISSEFLYYVLIYIAEYLKDISGGSTFGELTKEILRDVKIPFPPLSEQSRIATVLSWFDDLIENKKRQNEILEKVAMALFKNWFIDFEPFKNEEFVYNEDLGKEIPKGWEVKRIGNAFTLIKGKKCNLLSEKIVGANPYLLIESFKNKSNSFWTLEKECMIHELDVVLIADGESSGKVLRFKEGILGSTLLTLKQKKKEKLIDLRTLIYLYLKNIEDEIMEHRTGSAIPHLDKNYLIELLFVLPPPPILQSFHSLVEPIFQKIILNQKQIMLLRKIRDRLLPLLVFGKLRVEEI
ncbi:MAG: restriction endonuclease subunit S [Candidatus Altiarchaeota archaeon]